MIERFIFLTAFFIVAIFIPTNSHAFDYKSYSSKVNRSLEPIASKSMTLKKKKRKISTTSIAKNFLEKLDSDVIPASLFKSKDYSVYIKISKISKIGLKYKF